MATNPEKGTFSANPPGVRRPPVGLSTAFSSAPDDWDGSRLPFHRLNVGYADCVYAAGGLPVLLPAPGPGTVFGDEPREPGARAPEGLPANYGPGAAFPGLWLCRELAREALARVGGLILTGGPDLAATRPEGFRAGAADPARDPFGFDPVLVRDVWETALLEAALASRIPILGICRGLQLMNFALGGTLHGDIGREREGSADHLQKLPRGEFSHAVSLRGGSLVRGICGKETVSVNSGHHQAIKDVAPGLAVSGLSPDGVTEAAEILGHPFGLGVQWHPEGTPDSPESRAIFRAFVLACAGAGAEAGGEAAGEAAGWADGED
ncbi:MAG: gamma-glutamyl-gamma-aminobutyrate hydrolase family protein [Deltaproteobacteria bacterium]|jgi:putative glutamine amidotransferase|nr:gamma-glutamyl-gamma-aminobutyrate hydrolase family protein [Deltaproteobacteria bacterium]